MGASDQVGKENRSYYYSSLPQSRSVSLGKEVGHGASIKGHRRAQAGAGRRRRAKAGTGYTRGWARIWPCVRSRALQDIRSHLQKYSYPPKAKLFQVCVPDLWRWPRRKLAVSSLAFSKHLGGSRVVLEYIVHRTRYFSRAVPWLCISCQESRMSSTSYFFSPST